MNVFECRAERQFHSWIFKYGVECRAERRSHISIVKVCMLVNAELNIDPEA